jgi:hypothetical protein
MSVNQAGIEAALEAFLIGKDFKVGVILCTRAKRQKTGYVVELMPEGRYRLLLEAQVGDKNEEPDHVFLELPTLEDKDLTLWVGNEERYFNYDFVAKEEDLASQLRNQLKKDLEHDAKTPKNRTRKSRRQVLSPDGF